MTKDPALTDFTSRIDQGALRELERKPLPEPVDALNLVNFADEVSYRWYCLSAVGRYGWVYISIPFMATNSPMRL